MDKLGNKLGLLSVVLALFLSGCGKKDSKSTKHDASKKVASSGLGKSGIPTLEEETENFLDEEAVSDLAFVDDESQAKDKKAGKDSLLAQADEPSEEDGDGSSDYSFKTVHFDFNKNSIKKDQEAIVEEDCELAQNVVEQGKKVVVQGHTCQIGSAAYNMALSQRRAEAVKAEMIESGIPAENIKTVGYGYEMPLVWSDKKDKASLVKDLAPNRRAEVLVN